jgi:hypothetical protein
MFSPVSSTPADKLFAGVNDTTEKLFTRVNDTANKFFTDDTLY